MFETKKMMGTWLGAAVMTAALLLLGEGDAIAHCDTMSGPVVTAGERALESGNVNLALVWVQPGDEAAVRAEFARARAARGAGGAAQQAADRRFFEELVRVHRAGEGAPYTGIKPAGTDVGAAVEAADRALAERKVEPVREVVARAAGEGIERHFKAVADRQRYAPDDVAAGRAYVRAYVEYTHFAEALYDLANKQGAHGEHGDAAAHGGPACGAEAHGAQAHAEQGGPACSAAAHGADAHGVETHEPAAHGAEAHEPAVQGAAASGEPAEAHRAATHGAHAGLGGHAGHLPWVLVAMLGLAVVGETGWIVRRRKR